MVRHTTGEEGTVIRTTPTVPLFLFSGLSLPVRGDIRMTGEDSTYCNSISAGPAYLSGCQRLMFEELHAVLQLV